MKHLVVLKMSDSSEVMATVVDDGHTSFMCVEKARVVMFQQNPDNPKQTGVAFPPYMSIAGDSMIEISRAHIVTTLSVIPKALEDAYLQNTTGIALA